MGHHFSSMQQDLSKTSKLHRDRHGGVLRQKSKGRGRRPLSTKYPLHVVFKIHRPRLRERSLRGYRSFALAQILIRRYARKFFVKIDHFSIQGDHIHIFILTTRRSQYQSFFRVLAGQIAQVFAKEGLLTGTPAGLKTKAGLWRYRPFSRVVKGWRAYRIVRNYIQLNEKEAQGVIPYRKERLRGLSLGEWHLLWT